LFESINSHNRFSTDKDNLSDSRKFSKTNASPGGYAYYWGVYNPPINDLTRINPPTPFPTWAIATSTPNFPWDISRCGSTTGNKAIGKALTSIDSLKDALEYRQNYYSALVDNGNTDYLLSLIQNLQPNNFNFAYNKLMNASPYLSDTVLIRFMIHPINKPPFKKDVVLANSPLPIRVRPYIDQMNVNQNFKNQMWAAQTNNNNARVELENELANRDFGINNKFGDLVLYVLSDTVPEKTDSLLNYALLKGTLNERIITSPLFIGKERYADAQTNLSEVNYLNTDGNQQIVDFIQLQQLQMQLNQTPDSLRNGIILQNENWLNTIAFDTNHFCMSDALNLLEESHDTLYPRYVYVADEIGTRFAKVINKESAECSMIINPNPANSFVNVQIIDSDSLDDLQLLFCDITGKIISVYENVALTNFINIDLKSKKPGVYYLILLSKASVICSRKLIIE
jgi:hypothetical protein